jgi:N-acetylmuramoyl-L-alanine amidase
MAKKKIYLSASNQEENKGVGSYGSERDQMFRLRDKVRNLLKADFIIEANDSKTSSLNAIVKESNTFNPDIHMAFHTNAGSKKARGCEVFYYGNLKTGGFKMATLWYKHISAVTPTEDRGVKSDFTLYTNGLYELRETKASACLMEFIFHSNLEDVTFFLNNIDRFAEATRNAVYEYFGMKKDTVVYPKWLRAQKLVKNEYSKNDTFTVDQIDTIFQRFYEKYIK